MDKTKRCEKMIPLDRKEALKSGVYTCATTGSGKSCIAMYTAKKLMAITEADNIVIDNALVKKVIVVVFDPSGDWMERSTVPHVIRVKHKVRLPIPEESTIFDISGLGIKEHQEIVEQFCKDLLKHQSETPKELRNNYFLFFEEGQICFPQGILTAKRYQNTAKMMSVGRNKIFKVRFMCITPFSSLIDKKAMRYMKQRYFGATDEPNDVEYITKFFPRKNREDVAVTLGSFEAGEFIYKYGKKAQHIQIRPFDEMNPPTPKIPQEYPSISPIATTPQPEKRMRQKGNTREGKALVSILIALMWLMAIILALTMRPY